MKRLFFVLILFGIFYSKNLLAADCSVVSGSTETISSNCSDLEIEGDGSNVTVDSGVTIDSTNVAVKTANGTNTSITNNGTFEASETAGLRNSSPGNISNLINNGSITAGTNHGLRNGGFITILTNTGTISATEE